MPRGTIRQEMTSLPRLHPVRFEPQGVTVMVSAGVTLLEAARRGQLPLAGSCNGQGECNECLVEILEGELTPLSEEELALEEVRAAQGRLRLACRARVCAAVNVRLLRRDSP